MSAPGGGARMDPDQVRSGAAKFDVAADQLDDAHQELERQLQAQGACWGEDEAGQGFAKDYMPTADLMNESMKALTETLRSLRQQVQEAANDAQATDQGNADDIGGIRI
ncbi:WXG100 family type VII secretion target [Saccharopolyspora gloriosae]|uniref:WXG100 family type VII secretion target n=1 Tax=Saccharopolyspora gloriosae TaxID=455344 RepID=UPI001FB6A33C|nr:WXG100 family type VII secretion target [Saccharopolyspora gloriosae]